MGAAAPVINRALLDTLMATGEFAQTKPWPTQGATSCIQLLSAAELELEARLEEDDFCPSEIVGPSFVAHVDSAGGAAVFVDFLGENLGDLELLGSFWDAPINAQVSTADAYAVAQLEIYDTEETCWFIDLVVLNAVTGLDVVGLGSRLDFATTTNVPDWSGTVRELVGEKPSAFVERHYTLGAG